jgi:hypothetical protein
MGRRKCIGIAENDGSGRFHSDPGELILPGRWPGSNWSVGVTTKDPLLVADVIIDTRSKLVIVSSTLALVAKLLICVKGCPARLAGAQ